MSYHLYAFDYHCVPCDGSFPSSGTNHDDNTIVSPTWTRIRHTAPGHPTTILTTTYNPQTSDHDG